MAKEYILLKEKTEAGIIALNKSVFESIVKISEKDIEELYPITATRLHKPIQAKIIKNKLHISIDVNIKYGSNVSSVTKRLQKVIYDNILQSTNIKPSEITVNVISFSI